MSPRLLLLPAVILLLGAAEKPAPIPELSPAEAAKQGRAFTADLLAQRPANSVTNTGSLKIRAGRNRAEAKIRFDVVATPTNWFSVYHATSGSNIYELTVIHSDGPNEYRLVETTRVTNLNRTLTGNQTMAPFAGSDFWVCDLGLEFLHWPDQRLLKKEMKKNQSCDKLESINPHPAPGAYSRVICWIDDDSGGVVHADAYDFKGELLKEFDPRSFKKVKGQWELEEMEIYNDQTDSLTKIEFDLKK